MVAILPRKRVVVALLPALINNVLAVATYAYSRSSWEVDKRNEAAKANPVGSCEHFCDFQPLYTDAAHTFSCHGNPRWARGDVQYCEDMCGRCREVCSYEDRFKCPQKGNFQGPYEPDLPDAELRLDLKDTSEDKKEETDSNVLLYVGCGVGGLLLLGLIILCFVCFFRKSKNQQAASNQPVMMQQQPNYSPQQPGGNYGNQGAMQPQTYSYPSQNIPPYSYQTGNAFDYVHGGQNQPPASGIVPLQQ